MLLFKELLLNPKDICLSVYLLFIFPKKITTNGVIDSITFLIIVRISQINMKKWSILE